MPGRTTRDVTRRAFTATAAALGAAMALGSHTVARHRTATDATPTADAPALLLRMEPVGGTQPAELQLIAVPEFSLFDDGSIYRLGPVIAVYPPAALPNLTRMRVSHAAVSAIIEEARKAGLDQPLLVPETAMPESIPAHRFLFSNGGDLVESLVWGLTIDAAQAPDWDAETLALHQALRSLAAYLNNIPFNLPADELLEQEMPIDPDRLQVLSFEASPDLVLPSGVPNLEQPSLEWPLTTPLAELTSPFDPHTASELPELACAELSGVDAQTVVDASRKGDLTSPWVDGGVTYGLLLKPLLPDQSGCAPGDR